MVAPEDGSQFGGPRQPEMRLQREVAPVRPHGVEPGLAGAGPGVERQLARRRRRRRAARRRQDRRLRQLDPARGPVDQDRVVVGRAVRADLEAEVVRAEQPDQRPGAEAGLEGEGGVVAGGGLVDRRLDAGAGIVQQHRRRVDREPVPGVGDGAAEPEQQRGQVGLGHADDGHAVGEGDGGRVDHRRAVGAGRVRADVDDGVGAGGPAGAEVHRLGGAGSGRAGPDAVGGGPGRGADRRHRTARLELAGEGLVAVEGLRAGEAGELGRDVGQREASAWRPRRSRRGRRPRAGSGRRRAPAGRPRRRRRPAGRRRSRRCRPRRGSSPRRRPRPASPGAAPAASRRRRPSRRRSGPSRPRRRWRRMRRCSGRRRPGEAGGAVRCRSRTASCTSPSSSRSASLTVTCFCACAASRYGSRRWVLVSGMGAFRTAG